ncbi:MAG: hypothetical protein AUI93_04010 [Crenarchaeota archaeon 13_1_40CM_3_52_10]|nr:MAG: hypothetical protein AUI93_04010 [Crenarchaeota archaeon 13_1_40CM_3_52_10]
MSYRLDSIEKLTQSSNDLRRFALVSRDSYRGVTYFVLTEKKYRDFIPYFSSPSNGKSSTKIRLPFSDENH